MVNSREKNDQYLTSKQVQEIIPFSRATLRRMAKEELWGFPPSRIVGRSAYWGESCIFDYLSKQSGLTVKPGDSAITSKDIQAMFGKSHTWLYQNIKLKKFPEPFAIGRSRFWLKSQVDSLMSLDEA